MTIPTHCAEITPDWLNERLDGDLGRVVAVRVENLGAGVGILGEVARLHLTWAPGGSGPASMVAKCQAEGAENVFLCQVMGFYTREVNFYNEVASRVPIIVPAMHVAEVDPAGAPFVLLMDEIVGARCPNQIEGITVSEAEQIIDTVAALHIPFWNNADLAALQWLPPMNNPLYKAGKDMALAKWDAFQVRFRSRVDDRLVEAVGRVLPKYGEMLDWMAELGHPTLTHTDCRAENYLFGGATGEDSITVVDFQLCTRHVGAWDVANLLGGSLLPEVRRQHAAKLVERYHARIIAAGIQDYDLDTCWLHVRASLLQQVVSTVVVSDLDPANERGAELMENLLLRPWLAAADSQVWDLVDQF